MASREKVRRVVTGRDVDGRSVIAQDGHLDASALDEPGDDRLLTEVWTTDDAIGAAGSQFRVVDLPPGSKSEMHATDSVDYGIVLEGEVHLLLEADRTVLEAGDVVIQRGTPHAWANRSDVPARMVFVNLAGRSPAET